MTTIKPMLADNKPWNESLIQAHLDNDGFLWMQPKIDGLRVWVDDERLPRSRSGKEHKHKALRKFLMDRPSLRGYDGELVTGHEYTEDSFRKSMSGIRAEDGDPSFTFYMFDFIHSLYSYSERLSMIKDVVARLGGFHEHLEYHAKLVVCPTWKVGSLDEVYRHEERLLSEGWEGGILRRDGRTYKYGRSTAREGALLKLKRFTEDAEAIVIGYEPWYVNENEQTSSPLGYSVRSAHQDNLRPIERLGAWVCKLASDPSVEFKVGVLQGVTHADRDRLWADRDAYIGRIFKFKHQGYGGGYDKPRTPVFLNWRPSSEF